MVIPGHMNEFRSPRKGWLMEDYATSTIAGLPTLGTVLLGRGTEPSSHASSSWEIIVMAELVDSGQLLA